MRLLRTSRMRAVTVLAIPVLALAAYLALHVTAPASTCFAQGKKCGCPVTSGEKILIECKSVDGDGCGACSVTTAGGTREGRPCLALQ